MNGVGATIREGGAIAPPDPLRSCITVAASQPYTYGSIVAGTVSRAAQAMVDASGV